MCCELSFDLQLIITDVDGSIRRTFAITVRAAIINSLPVFTPRNYRFRLSENAEDNDEIGLIVVTDDTGTMNLSSSIILHKRCIKLDHLITTACTCTICRCSQPSDWPKSDHHWPQAN